MPICAQMNPSCPNIIHAAPLLAADGFQEESVAFLGRREWISSEIKVGFFRTDQIQSCPLKTQVASDNAEKRTGWVKLLERKKGRTSEIERDWRKERNDCLKVNRAGREDPPTEGREGGVKPGREERVRGSEEENGRGWTGTSRFEGFLNLFPSLFVSRKKLSSAFLRTGKSQMLQNFSSLIRNEAGIGLQEFTGI